MISFFTVPFTVKELFGKLKSSSVWSIKISFIYISVLNQVITQKMC